MSLRLIDPRNPVSWLLVIISWAIIYYVVQKFFLVVLIAFFVVAILGFLYNLFRYRKKEHILTLSLGESIHTTSFGLATTLAMYVGISYFLPDKYLPTLALFLITGFLNLFVFFLITHYCHDLYTEKKRAFARALLTSFIHAIILSLIFGLVVYGLFTAALKEGQALTQEIIPPGEALTTLQVEEDLLASWTIEYTEITRTPVQCTIFSFEECITQAEKHITYALHAQQAISLQQGIANLETEANRLTDIQQRSLLQQIQLGEEAFTFETTNIQPLPYKEAKSFLETRNNEEETLYSIINPDLGDTPLTASTKNYFEHTKLHQATLTLIRKAENLELTTTEHPSVQVIYNNREIDETTTSKLIRYQLLAQYQQLKKEIMS